MSETAAGNLRQRRAAETRQQILTAAREVFEERGYQATSVGAITDRATTAHGTFYLYFRNKEDVFCEVMRTAIVDELAIAIERPPDATPHQALEHIVRSFLAAYQPRSRLWRAVMEAAFQSPRVEHLWLALRRSLIERAILGLQAGQERGAIRPLDPVLSGHALTSMAEWFAFAHFELREPPPDEHSIERVVEVLVDLWYHAIYGVVDGDQLPPPDA